MVLGSGWLAGEMKDWEAVSDERVRKAPPGRFHRHRDDYDDEMVWLSDEAGGGDLIRLRSQRGGVGQNGDHGRREGDFSSPFQACLCHSFVSHNHGQASVHRASLAHESPGRVNLSQAFRSQASLSQGFPSHASRSHTTPACALVFHASPAHASS